MSMWKHPNDTAKGIDCKSGRLAKKGMESRMNRKENENGWGVVGVALRRKIVREEALLTTGDDCVRP